MNCTECGIELASPDFRGAASLGDCWPVCSLCAHKGGGPRPANNQQLRRTLYGAGRKISSCAGCGDSGGGGELEIHFLSALASGGGGTEANLLVLCPSCHDKVHQGAGIRVGVKIIRHGQSGP